MQKMQVLSIGNSFSQDAHRYIHRIAKTAGVDLKTVNLYIGGCELKRHYDNMISDKSEYELEVNGEPTGSYISIKNALLSQKWNYITFQQASHDSNDYATYQPYLNELVKYARELCPDAKILMHETWAYEEGSDRLYDMMGYSSAKAMYNDLHEAYAMAAMDVQSDGIILSGTLLQHLLAAGIEKVHRDTFHASLGVGRYAIGLLWYRVVTGNSVADISFCDFDEEISEQEMEIVKNCVEELYMR